MKIEPAERDREMARQLYVLASAMPRYEVEAEINKQLTTARIEGHASRPNLPPLFEPDDWLWVIQSLGYVNFACDDDRRMTRIVGKLFDYHSQDLAKEANP